jgi:hypothetical protein
MTKVNHLVVRNLNKLSFLRENELGALEAIINLISKQK